MLIGVAPPADGLHNALFGSICEQPFGTQHAFRALLDFETLVKSPNV
jgi:hypothetical protein